MAEKFADEVGKFAELALGRLKNVVTGSVFDLAKEVVGATPVNTGRARGNWVCQLEGEMPKLETGRLDKTGDATLAATGSELDKFEAGATKNIWLTNTLPYILELENGGSDQAPRGMMRLAAQKFPDIVKRNVGKRA